MTETLIRSNINFNQKFLKSHEKFTHEKFIQNEAKKKIVVDLV